MLITLPLPSCVRNKLKTYTPRGLFPDLPRENGTARPHPQPADVRAERQKVEEKGNSKGGSGSDKEDQGVVGERGGVKDRGADVLPPGQRTCWNAPCVTARERMEALTTKAQGSPARGLSAAGSSISGVRRAPGCVSCCIPLKPWLPFCLPHLPGLEGLDDEDHIPIISLSPESPGPAWLRVRGQDKGMSECLRWNVEASIKGFPHSSVGKESTCNAGDPGSIPCVQGRYPGEGRGYPPQYSRASLVAQLVKNPPTVRETWIRSLGWEDPLEKGKATHSSILAWRITWAV